MALGIIGKCTAAVTLGRCQSRRTTLTYAADVTKRRLAGALYVIAPGLLVLLYALTDLDWAYAIALVVALPLSLVANVVAFVVGGLIVDVDGNAAPLAAALMSGAALVQLLALSAVLHRRRAEVQRG